MLDQRQLVVLDTWLRDRQRARTDLLWLLTEVLQYRDIERKVHSPIIEHLQKFPGGTDYVNKFSGKFLKYEPKVDLWHLQGPRKRLILYPRGHLKTTIITIGHSIQWILNYVDIRIMVSSATGEQVKKIITEMKAHFQFNNNFRFLFPEYCPEARKAGDFGTQEAFTIPCRKRKWLKEQTVSTCSVGKVIAGAHMEVHKHSDLVDKENIRTPDQIRTVRDHYRYMGPLLERGPIPPHHGWEDIEGTRYDFCLDGKSKILMADWFHKPIEEVQVGDEVIGWSLVASRRGKAGKGGWRKLQKAKVIARGSLQAETRKYTFASGETIVATAEHRWWRGKGWNKNLWGENPRNSNEYGQLGFNPRQMKSLRRLLMPLEKDNTRSAGWLAGFYDGEGSFQKNPHHPSGCINIYQSMHNPDLIERVRHALKEFSFDFRETWHSPSKSYGLKNHKDRCVFTILGGWLERYRFLAQIQPYRRNKIAESLFGQMFTEEDKLVSVEDGGTRKVYWFQSETGNYFVEGYASKNSDMYGTEVIDKEEKLPESKRQWAILIDSAERSDGTILWPTRFPKSELDIEKQKMGDVLYAAQYLNKPIPDSGGLTTREEIKFIPREIVRRIPLRVHCTIDLHGMEQGARNDFTVFNVTGFDRDARAYMLDLRHARFTPFQVIDNIFHIFDKWKCDFKIEKDAHARVLLPFLTREMAKRGKYPIIIPIHRDTRVSKKQRIWGLQAWFKGGIIRFCEDLDCRLELTQEILRFSQSSSYHDDILDTMADQMQNREGGVTYDLYPDEQKGENVPEYMRSRAFTGFDPISKGARFLGDKETPASEWFHPGTGL